MDVPQDVDLHLENLNKCIATEERKSLLTSIWTKCSKILAKIQEKGVVNGITLILTLLFGIPHWVCPLVTYYRLFPTPIISNYFSFFLDSSK